MILDPAIPIDIRLPSDESDESDEDEDHQVDPLMAPRLRIELPDSSSEGGLDEGQETVLQVDSPMAPLPRIELPDSSSDGGLHESHETTLQVDSPMASPRIELPDSSSDGGLDESHEDSQVDPPVVSTAIIQLLDYNSSPNEGLDESQESDHQGDSHMAPLLAIELPDSDSSSDASMEDTAANLAPQHGEKNCLLF